jgi:hypothetical protein
VRLRGDNTQKLTADNLKEGSYVFTLTVKDKKGQSDSDSARITVLPGKKKLFVAILCYSDGNETLFKSNL